MDDNNPTPTSTEPTEPNQVMDVKVTPPPEGEIDMPDSAVPTVEADEASASGESAAEETKDDGDQAKKDLLKESGAADLAANNASPAMPPHKSGTPVFAIVTAVVVALGLVGVTVYAYMQTLDDQDKMSTSQNQESTEQVTGEDVDQTTSEVDDALRSTEEADFPESELTDQNLNL